LIHDVARRTQKRRISSHRELGRTQTSYAERENDCDHRETADSVFDAPCMDETGIGPRGSTRCMVASGYRPRVKEGECADELSQDTGSASAAQWESWHHIRIDHRYYPGFSAAKFRKLWFTCLSKAPFGVPGPCLVAAGLSRRRRRKTGQRAPAGVKSTTSRLARPSAAPIPSNARRINRLPQPHDRSAVAIVCSQRTGARQKRYPNSADWTGSYGASSSALLGGSVSPWTS
jgi:hypothetical protein